MRCSKLAKMLSACFGTRVGVNRTVPGPRTRRVGGVQVRNSMASSSNGSDVEIATFALGWFWHPEASFKKIGGVLKTRVGYTGGRTPNPTYMSVCDGDGHTEALRIWFDPGRVTYEQLLEHFFTEHNPTVRDKAQYKSAIWYHSDAQRQAAADMIAKLEAKYGMKIATTLDQEQPWTDAEDYHQDYLNKFVTRRYAGW